MTCGSFYAIFTRSTDSGRAARERRACDSQRLVWRQGDVLAGPEKREAAATRPVTTSACSRCATSSRRR